MRTLRRLDWLERFELRPASDPGPEVTALGVTPQALAGAIHCVTPDGRVMQAARCLRFIGLRVPLLMPVALLLWVPGMLPLAEVVYRWVSQNRYRFRPCRCGANACKLEPPKPALDAQSAGSQSRSPSPSNRGA